MKNGTKITIGIIAILAIVYALLAFDIGREKDVDVKDLGVSDLIRVDAPEPNATIGTPARFSGEARGVWFFEATFPIDVRALDGTILGRGYAEAQGEWMTEDFVPWTADISFDAKGNTSGVVRFMKDNPSGLPENDAHIDVPVKFSTTGTSTQATCKPSGCSGQICSDRDMASTCEFRAEYACYRTAECKRQSNGQCGWTETSTLRSCLNNPPPLE